MASSSSYIGGTTSSTGDFAQAKKLKVSEDSLSTSETPDDATLDHLMKTFEANVTSKLASVEEQLRDAAFRLDARMGDLELTISLAENRIALALDPRHLENIHKWKESINDLEETLGKVVA